MSASQFIRCQAFKGNEAEGILGEASRHPGFCTHVENPKPPIWTSGSAKLVEIEIVKYMSRPAPVLGKTGKAFERKRRFDHRCLIAGTVSWPDKWTLCNSPDYPAERLLAMKEWRKRTVDWLKDQFNKNLIGICEHRDEPYFHMHFFVVGDAQRLHPGMKNELVNNKRLVVSAERLVAHKLGLKGWLDDFHKSVGQPCGLLRSLGSRPAWRIKDRGARLKLLSIEKDLAERPETSIQTDADEVWDDLQKLDRPRMVF